MHSFKFVTVSCWLFELVACLRKEALLSVNCQLGSNWDPKVFVRFYWLVEACVCLCECTFNPCAVINCFEEAIPDVQDRQILLAQEALTQLSVKSNSCRICFSFVLICLPIIYFNLRMLCSESVTQFLKGDGQICIMLNFIYCNLLAGSDMALKGQL